jgi:hypothetical protein
MKPMHKLLVGNLAVVALAGMTAWGAEGWTRYNSQPGTANLIRIDGTSTVHDWEVESRVVGGFMEVGPGFPTTAAAAKPGKVEAKVEVFLPVRALKSMKDGKPYSNAMDGIMYEKLLEPTNKMIKFSLTEMTLGEAPKADGPMKFDTKGNLTVAGVTKEIAMPVEMKLDGNKLKFVGSVALKMSDFKIEPPSPTIALGAIKTGDDVKLTIDWTAVQKK